MNTEVVTGLAPETVTDWSVYPNFKEREFACRCGCGSNRISKKLLDMLQRARTIAGVPFVITSGCRCPRHNSTVSKSQNSDHLCSPPLREGTPIISPSREGAGGCGNPSPSGEVLVCFGVDIATSNDRARFVIDRALKQVGFDRIGIDRRFIHAGISTGLGGRNASDQEWLY